MTTKRELERLARKAFGKDVLLKESFISFEVSDAAGFVYVEHGARKERRELLAAALRGIIAWKEGKK